MNLEHYLFYGAIGKLLIYLVQKSPYGNFIGKIIGREDVRRFLQELLSCDLCLGVFVYAILAWIMKTNIINIYVPVVSELITGAGMSFIVHLLSIGWREKFSIIHIS